MDKVFRKSAKKLAVIVSVFVFMVGTLMNSTIVKADGVSDWIPDPVLQELFRSALGLPDVSDLTKDNVLDLEFLTIESKDISSLSGLEFAQNLKGLFIYDTDLSDVSLTPVASLENVEYIIVNNANLSDLSELENASLPQLFTLDLSYNSISDISVIKTVNLPNLIDLYVSYNQIEDISSIAQVSLPNLEIIDASNNLLRDVDAFKDADFPEIRSINVSDNHIEDIRLIEGLQEKFVNLREFNVPGNHIIDIRPLIGFELDNASAQNQTNDLYLTFVKPDAEDTFFITNSVESVIAQSVSGGYKMIADPLKTEQNIQTYDWDQLFDNEMADLKIYSTLDGSEIVDPYDGSSVDKFVFSAAPDRLPETFQISFDAVMGRFTGNINIHINWVDVYTLSFDLNGGTGTIASQDVVEGDYAVSVDDPIRDDYQFTGWNTEADGSGTNWDFAVNTMPASDVVLYAQWALTATPVEHTLSFDLNGGTGTIASQNVVEGDYAVSVDNPVRDGYQFTGWNTEADGSGTNWDFAVNTMPASDVVLYAQWALTATPVEHTLSFDLNGGTGTIASQNVVEGDYAVSVDNPVRAGYQFTGWNTEADGSGTNWDFAVNTMPASNVILYAQWQKETEIIKPELPGTGIENGTLGIYAGTLLSAGAFLIFIANRKRKNTDTADDA